MKDIEDLRRQLAQKASERLAAGGRLSDPDVVALSQELDRLVAEEAEKPAADAVFAMEERSE